MDIVDPDPVEAGEWVEAIRSVLEREGPARARHLLHTISEEMNRSGLAVPMDANTPYVNTIPVGEQEPLAGDVEIERRVRRAPDRLRPGYMPSGLDAICSRAQSAFGEHVA